jgi:hypothetical protein
MYVVGDVLFSYGEHFPLLVRREFGVLLNADKYSMTTSHHQAQCMRFASLIIPFSALGGAGIGVKEFELVDKSKARLDLIDYFNVKDIRDRISPDEFNRLSTAEQENWLPHVEHRPESAILTVGDKYYLSSMDGENYFLAELPEPTHSVDDAFDMLVPNEVKGREYKRQGEWFFIKVADGDEAKRLYELMDRDFVFPVKGDARNRHIATRGCVLDGRILVSGRILHRRSWGGRGDHRMLRLSTLANLEIFQAFENRAVNSWSASGNVD